MGACCNNANLRTALADKKETDLTSPNTKLDEPISEKSSKPPQSNNMEQVFHYKARTISSNREDINVRITLQFHQAIAVKIGDYVYPPMSEDGLKRVLQDPIEVENEGTYYGFWYFFLYNKVQERRNSGT